MHRLGLPVIRPADHRTTTWVFILGATALGAACLAASRSDGLAPVDKGNSPGRAAPELDGGVAWFNTSAPIHLSELRGKVVLLDFWTFCCINCIHTLPDLARLERKYADLLVVIGVHSAKFDNEKDSESIRKAVLRYEITHPVVNDASAKIWDAYGITSWPTLCLIDPEGHYLSHVQGEGNYELLDRAIGRLVDLHRQKKTLDERPRRFAVAGTQVKGDSPLFFPGKVLADEISGRLFIADSSHHRIVITDLAGKKIAIAGAGRPGCVDGSFEEARFNDPQGMALAGNSLYVADRKNHSIRSIDLATHTVRTVAGTGTQDRSSRGHGGPGAEAGLRSPWDLCLHGDTLYIAMAGHHQIWSMDLRSGVVGPFAGNGREALADGPLTDASFAQPSGLATDGTYLYVADSESSAIRSVPLEGRGEVRTLVGRGLFEFGDVDGTADAVRLQHALGIAYARKMLYVADTYNSKLKAIYPERRTCRSLAGGKSGWLAGPILSEPGGLSYAHGKLYVADTNAHRIRVFDLESKSVATLAVQGVSPPG